MTIEIELKFIATPQAAEKLAQTLAAWPHQHHAARELTNIYYETDDNQLRRWDMGLRIRGVDQRYEMTLKTAGKTLGACISVRNTTSTSASRSWTLPACRQRSGRRGPMLPRFSRVCSRCSAPISSVKPGW